MTIRPIPGGPRPRQFQIFARDCDASNVREKRDDEIGEPEAIKKKLPSLTRTGKTTSDRSPIHSLKLGWPNLAAKGLDESR